MDSRDRVDIAGIPKPSDPHAPKDSKGPARPFLLIWFRCCHAYGRLTKTDDGSAYVGRCPRCRAHCEVPVGPGGTTRRMFEAR
ncbi:MAG: hypothetical protein U0572_17195 [Phycisphaerales bacterium]